MPIFRTGMVMAAIYQDDDSALTATERFLYRILQRVGPYKRAIRERWLFGQAATLELYKEGIRNFLVLGAGIPTSGHAHQLVREAKVLYVDKDPSIVSTARELLADEPSVHYIQGDLMDWEASILPHCQGFFGPSPRMGIIMVGVHGLLPPEPLRRLFQGMYQWAGKGSALILTNADLGVIRNNPSLSLRYNLVALVYRFTGNKLYLRTDAELRELVKPWQVEKARPFWGWLPHQEAPKEAPIYWGYKLRKP